MADGAVVGQHIAVVGAMGCGKTTVGLALAEALHLPFVDNDEQLAQVEGTDARTLAATRGIDALHEVEARLLLTALASTSPAVVAAASSTIEVAQCREALDARATTVWLHGTAADLAARASAGGHRPDDADDRDLVDQRARRRDGLYAAVADIDVDVSAHDPVTVVALVLERLQQLPRT